MTPLDRKILLLQKALTTTGLAARIRRPRSLVAGVLSGKRTSPSVRRAIASELGRSFRELWGEEDPGIDRRPKSPRVGLTPVTLERGNEKSTATPHDEDACSSSSHSTAAA